jgi:tetraacyldisaccharide 4'-kinase
MRSYGIAERLPGLWYRPRFVLALVPLLPLSWLFRLLVWARRTLYRCGILSAHRLAVPVIVIGNLTVGGSGKTPLVLWLVAGLRELGWRPGIISRGYGGSADKVQAVAPDAAAAIVGDEPLLLARRSGVPVFVGRDRVAAGRALLSAHPECNVVVSDDGLQHYRLQRAVEIAVFDRRGAGNAQLLPAGPLREPLRRLSAVTALVWNVVPQLRAAMPMALACDKPQYIMRLAARRFVDLNDAGRTCSADDLCGKRLYALAGIGDPARFFAQLEALGLGFEAHPFSDHHVFSAADLAFARDGVLLITEKDAVKCAKLTPSETWVLPVDAQVDATLGDPALLDLILEKIDGCAPA